MPRARLLKPSFFKNELLADLGLAARVLFEGLWCLADREGRLEDRPRRIKADVMPYDDCDVDALLVGLHESGFIHRYQIGGERYIQVVNFLKHQTPHVKEAASVIPAPEKHSASTSKEQGETSPISPRIKALTGNPIPLAVTLEPEDVVRETAAEPPAPDPDKPIASIPKAPSTEFDAVKACFVARGLRAPPITGRDEAPAARRLLKQAGDPDLLAACWQDIRTGEFGDVYAQQHLSFVYLDRQNRFENWRAWKEGEVGAPKRVNGHSRAAVAAGVGAARPASPFAKFGNTLSPAPGSRPGA